MNAFSTTRDSLQRSTQKKILMRPASLPDALITRDVLYLSISQISINEQSEAGVTRYVALCELSKVIPNIAEEIDTELLMLAKERFSGDNNQYITINKDRVTISLGFVADLFEEHDDIDFGIVKNVVVNFNAAPPKSIAGGYL